MTKPNLWLAFALGSAFFAALTAILGKVGVGGMNSNLATFIRTMVILAVTGGLITLRGEWGSFDKLSLTSLLALTASGIATGLSWLCYYRALQLGPASKVAPVDKLSVVMVVFAAALFLHEQLTLKTVLGSLLIAGGVVLTIG